MSVHNGRRSRALFSSHMTFKKFAVTEAKAVTVGNTTFSRVAIATLLLMILGLGIATNGILSNKHFWIYFGFSEMILVILAFVFYSAS